MLVICLLIILHTFMIYYIVSTHHYSHFIDEKTKAERLTFLPKLTHLIKNISIFFDITEEEREGGKKGGREGETFLNPHDPHALPSSCSHLWQRSHLEQSLLSASASTPSLPALPHSLSSCASTPSLHKTALLKVPRNLCYAKPSSHPDAAN